MAYRRVREEVDGLLALSDEAVEILENKVALQIERPHPAPDDELGRRSPDPDPESPQDVRPSTHAWLSAIHCVSAGP
ncbi:hypothetical protein GCM10023065_31160 [Microbacterium laevaniformans]